MPAQEKGSGMTSTSTIQSSLKSPSTAIGGVAGGGCNRTRLETNLARLLTRCETMAMDTDAVATNWRLDKYTQALEDMLSDLKTSPNQPSKETLQEYSKRVEFIRGVIHTAKLPSLSEKAVASQLIGPGSVASAGGGGDYGPCMEIKHRHVTKYSEDLRKELLGDPTPTKGSSGDPNKPEELDELIKYHHQIQEKIADHMLELTRTLKEQAKTAGNIIKQDTELLTTSSKRMDENEMNLKAETEKLEVYNKSACKCWVWFLLILVCSIFIVMVLFMRLFKKRKY
ncbi:unnamed protein product [Orchesella dallaii]|uniref:Vesicle transport protein USE1 n=1 Tax=Orchesella dallaii TaxID=48710 RepID=A0ABP1RBG6_9HEXA